MSNPNTQEAQAGQVDLSKFEGQPGLHSVIKAILKQRDLVSEQNKTKS